MTRTVIPTLLTFLLGAAIALSLLAAVTHVAHAMPDAGSHASPVATTGASPIEMPPDVLRPEPAEDVRSLLRNGAYFGAGILGVFGLVVLLMRLSRHAGPEKQRERALYATAAVAALGTVADLIASGQTPNAGMLVGAGAVFVALVLRSPLPPRRPVAVELSDVLGQPVRITVTKVGERGSMLLVCVATAGMLAGGAGIASCASTGSTTTPGTLKALASDLVDCTTEAALRHVAEYGPLIESAIRAATSADGTVNWSALRTAAASLGLESGACAIAETVARLASPQPLQPGVFASALSAPGTPSPESLRAGLAELEYSLWGGRRFKTSAGIL